MQLGQYMIAGRKIFLWSYALNAMENDSNQDSGESKVISFIETWAGYGYQFVMGIDFLDVLAFQKNVKKAREFVEKNWIKFAVSLYPTELADCDTFWSSCAQITQKSDTFAQAIQKLPNRNEIMELKEILDKASPLYVVMPEPRLHSELKEKLGVSAHATVSEMAIATLEKEKTGDETIVEEFLTYVEDYNKWKGEALECMKVIKLDGSMYEAKIA